MLRGHKHTDAEQRARSCIAIEVPQANRGSASWLLTRPVTALSNSCMSRKTSALALRTKSISSRTKVLGKIGDLSHFASEPAQGARLVVYSRRV